MTLQFFPTFADPSDTDGDLGGGDGVVQGFAGGVVFTVSIANTAPGQWGMILGDNLTLANTGPATSLTFTLTWNGGPGSTQASSIEVAGNFDPGEVLFVTSNGTVSAVDDVAFQGQVSAVRFILAPNFDTAQLDSISLALNCFAPGTRIATLEGPKLVEDLSERDLVMTDDGRAVPIRWIGRRTVDSRHEHPAKINPIRITAGALGHGLPERDLRLSKDHAVEIDGVLYDAGTLVNGVSIYQEQTVLPEGFTYYHVETDAHELLLAEGVAAESFIDHRNHDAFDNGDDLRGPIPEMNLPRVSSKRMIPNHIRDHLIPPFAAE